MAKQKLLRRSKGVSFPAAGSLKEAASAVLKQSKRDDARKPDVLKKVQDAASKDEKHKRGNKMTLKMNKVLGQHLLKNPGIVNKIIAAAEIKRSDVVLEIGPGTGNLTVKLCGMARKVRALELDHRMVSEVKKRALKAGHTNLEVIQGDALKQDFGQFNVCTANLPYQISSPFIFRLVSIPQTYRAAVLMFQKEFGERLISRPGEKYYCRLAINSQLFCKCTRVCNVSAASFNPPPKVDSIVIKLVPRKISVNINYAQWDGMLRMAFSRKRRLLGTAFTQGKPLITLKNLYEAGTNTSVTPNEFKAYVKGILSKISYNEETDYSKKRAIDLDIPDFIRLLTAFNNAGILFPICTSKRNVAIAEGIAANLRDSDRSSVPLSFFADDAKEAEDDADCEDEDKDEEMS